MYRVKRVDFQGHLVMDRVKDFFTYRTVFVLKPQIIIFIENMFTQSF